jgi:hypothetical protein
MTYRYFCFEKWQANPCHFSNENYANLVNCFTSQKKTKPNSNENKPYASCFQKLLVNLKAFTSSSIADLYHLDADSDKMFCFDPGVSILENILPPGAGGGDQPMSFGGKI